MTAGPRAIPEPLSAVYHDMRRHLYLRRLKIGMSRDTLARQINSSRQHVRYIELGLKGASGVLLIAWARALDMRIRFEEQPDICAPVKHRRRRNWRLSEIDARAA